MTVIVVRDGIMAADSQITESFARYANTKKLYRLPDGSLVGFSGSSVNAANLSALMSSGVGLTPKILKGFKNVIGLHLRHDGCWLIEAYGEGRRGIIKLEGPFFAEGSGGALALAAMHAGANARKAVEIACRIDMGCGLPVRSAQLRAMA